ncbi:conserved hypothetical protein [Bradyrhizobium oligotrophicum S58]|uniref:Uncharacterized protein n=1 Tax=Bradyrhizobium oligotrophicum S58 TaxID=1245469 RepID=M4Z5V4_9BRAD|nr:hypothetical protein [Bradyrhizobium oligotrophicum]BAM88381.1 conserved hypothetical protein [Bradyrhizobium oligotrophicum S58]
MIHRGVQYTVVATAEPDIWEWRYEFGDQVKTGRTQTRLAALAARRVKSKIDAALRTAQTGSVSAANVVERIDLAKATSHGLT